MANGAAGRTVKIPHKLDNEIMDMVADGKITTDIHDHLFNKYRVVCSLSCVLARIYALKKQNKKIAHAALAQQVIKSTINHTELFENNIRTLTKEIADSFAKKNKIEANALLNTQLKIQQNHLALLGIDKPKEQHDDSSLLAGLLKNLGPKDE